MRKKTAARVFNEVCYDMEQLKHSYILSHNRWVSIKDREDIPKHEKRHMKQKHEQMMFLLKAILKQSFKTDEEYLTAINHYHDTYQEIQRTLQGPGRFWRFLDEHPVLTGGMLLFFMITYAYICLDFYRCGAGWHIYLTLSLAILVIIMIILFAAMLIRHYSVIVTRSDARKRVAQNSYRSKRDKKAMQELINNLSEIKKLLK